MTQHETTTIDELVALAPQALVERLRALADDLQLAYAANTLRAWRASWRTWTAFCRAHGHPALPADVAMLRSFLIKRIAAGRRRSTLELNLSTLAMVHRLARLPWALETMEGKLMWRGLRREYLKARARQKRGITIEELERMLAPLTHDDARDLRDGALLRVGYETQLRRSELVSLKLEQLTIEADGSGSILLERSKTDQEGEGVVKYLSVDAVERLQRWLAFAGITDGALFRSTPRSNKRTRFDKTLTDHDVARIYKRHAQAAGLDASQVSGHSLRIGATQDMLAAGFSGAEVQRQGGWKSERMVIRYGEKLAVRRGAMARLLNRRSGSSSD